MTCTECADVDCTEYEFLMKSTNLHWFCIKCDEKAVKAVQIDGKIEEAVAAYEGRVKVEIDEIKARLDKLEREGAQDVKRLAETVDMIVKEPKDAERREKNIVLTFVPEVKEKLSIEDLQKRDTEDAVTLLKEMGCKEIPTRVMRLGSKDAERSRPRPMLVCFQNKEIADKVFHAKSNLREAENWLKAVWVNRDLTRLERTREYEMRKDRRMKRQKRADGAKDQVEEN